MNPQKIETHTHTKFSPDSKQCPEELVKRAIEMGLEYIAITDHMDIDFPFPYPDNFVFKPAEQIAEVLRVQEKYKKQIYVASGIECGWSKTNEEKNKQHFEKYNSYDYVINSIHVVYDIDVYREGFFETRDKHTAYTQYLECILNSLSAPYRINAVAHLGYITRVAMHYKNDNLLPYNEFSDILDEIFKTIIDKNLILELNTNVFKSPYDVLPNLELLKKYRELGGQNVTYASDAHTLDNLGFNYKLAATTAINAGFNEWTYVKSNKHYKIKI